MVQSRNAFAMALSDYDQQTLKEAFDRANEASSRPLHRTTLSRWLEGSVPNNGEFVSLLATELNDEELLAKWQASRGTRTTSTAQAAVSRFEALDEDERAEAYIEIRRLFLETRFPRLLDHLRYRIEVNDPVNPDEDHLVIRMTMEYDSSLPANSQVEFVPTHGQLSDAYEKSQCLFRDRVAIEPAKLEALLESGPPPVLNYNHLDRVGQRMIKHEARWLGDGVFEFDNDAVEKARVRLSLDYPYPRGVQVFPIRFGDFRVAGGAEFTLALNAHGTSRPEAFAFPPVGRHREWAVDLVREDELVASLGGGGTILADGDGLVLSWAENE